MNVGRDFVNEYNSAQSVKPAVLTSSTNGVGVDMQDCGPEVISVLSVGAASGTSATLDVKLQESDDNSTFTDISGATHTQLTDSDSNTTEVIQTAKRSKRYVRAVATLAGTSPSFATSVTLHAPKTSY